MSRKYTIEFVRAEFEKEGYILLSKEYINAHSKLEYICPSGHRHSIRFYSWLSGKRCPYCAGNRNNIVGIREEFKKEGCILLTKVYHNQNQKLEYICSNGHNSKTSLKNWTKGIRCHQCFIDKQRLSIKQIRVSFEEEGYTLLTKEYKNNKQKLDYICPEGHRHSITWSDWKNGIRCPYCSRKIKHTIEFVRNEVEKEGYSLLTPTYKNAYQTLRLKCPYNHEFNTRWGYWQQGYRCPKCSNNGVSIWEGVVKTFVSTTNKKFLENDRTQIFNPTTNRYLELDLWFPDLNKAIECNGAYWHSKKDRKDLDNFKQEWCKDHAISLLVVTDIEWNEDIKKCQKKIKRFLN
jgi:DNA-directed RNA polymerase subunit RPC12/RpoP